MKADENEASFLKSRAFKEGVAVFLAIGLLGLVILATTARSRKNPWQIVCVNNLKQVNLGLRMWSSDAGDSLPMQVSTNHGGSLEWAASKEVYRHFLAASNEIANPKVLSCPADNERSAATNFNSLRNQSLSYWLELNAKEAVSIFLLVGDRHLNTNGVLLPNGCVSIASQQALGWGPGLHGKEGNVSLTDGSVQQLNASRLRKLQMAQQIATNWFAIP